MDNTKLFNPDHLKHLCQKYGLRPSKQYGQNFLIDAEVINKILAVANLSKQDTVVEVGPGFGTLTLSLAEQAGRVFGFEIEKKLQDYWENNIQEKKINNLEIIWGNVLNRFNPTLALPFAKGRGIATPPPSQWRGQGGGYTSRTGQGKVLLEAEVVSPYKVIANIPYQITSPLIKMFLESSNPPSEMILMIQREVAERICALPGAMSLLALSVQLYSKPAIVFPVPRESFWPVPRVDSAVIKLTPKTPGLSSQEISKLFKLARLGFSSKRKVLLKNLKSLIPAGDSGKIMALLESFGLTKTARAQELSLPNWLDLSASL
ncbi:MAG: rRNA adenine dimethyltransferase family protein [Candidatus Magasanikbacteria bacterium]|nr:rRNA adenine dimethyltransferase family protein [Candidatus Magasanikbacteria bacterium]